MADASWSTATGELGTDITSTNAKKWSYYSTYWKYRHWTIDEDVSYPVLGYQENDFTDMTGEHGTDMTQANSLLEASFSYLNFTTTWSIYEGYTRPWLYDPGAPVIPIATLNYEVFEGQYCKVYFNDDLYFTGIIDTQTKKRVVELSSKIIQTVSTMNLKNILTRRTIRISYDEGDATDDIVSDMITGYLYQDGITAGTIDSGIDLENMWNDDCISIYDVIDYCASKNGYQWYIDNNMALQFFQDPTVIVDADYDIDDSNYQDLANFQIKGTINNYVNKLFTVGGNDSNGNQIFSIRGNLTEQNAIQLLCGGSGVYGEITRDGNNVETVITAAETGTTTTNITVTGHGLQVDDFIWNLTRSAFTLVSAVVDANNVTVETVTSQTTGDELTFYPSSNLISENVLKKQSVKQKFISFDCNYIDFVPGTRLKVTLPEYSIEESYWNIETVNIVNVQKNLYKISISATLRENDNFSTQKAPNNLNYFKNF